MCQVLEGNRELISSPDRDRKLVASAHGVHTTTRCDSGVFATHSVHC
jgi:hypothetical protein